MKCTVVFIVSCYIGLSYEYIAPQGPAKNEYLQNLNKSAVTILNATEKSNESLSSHKDNFDKDLYASSQPKSSEINERAYIYMKSIRPIHNKLYLSQIRNDAKDDRNSIHEGKLYGDLGQLFESDQKRKECTHGEDNTNSINGSDCKPNGIETRRLKSELSKRDFFELLKMPLLRLVSKNTEETRKGHKLNTKTKNTDIHRDSQNIEKDDNVLDSSVEVEKLLDQFVNVTFEKSIQKHKTNNKVKPDCNILEMYRNMCKCKIGTFDTENTFYGNDDIV